MVYTSREEGRQDSDAEKLSKVFRCDMIGTATLAYRSYAKDVSIIYTVLLQDRHLALMRRYGTMRYIRMIVK